MGARGPKSGSELTTIGPAGIEVRRRLDAPEDLTHEAAEVWRSIVSSNPADLFSPGSAPLLAQLCRHTIAARRIAQWLAKVEAADGPLDEARWFQLLARQEAESKTIAQLATRLRLTPQSRYTPHSAGTAARKARTGPAPWEGSSHA